MKNITLFLFVLLPVFCFGQRQLSLEVYVAPGYTNITKSLVDDQGKAGYHFGIGLTGQMRNERLYWVAGLQFSAFGTKNDESVLRWGSQHNGSGGFEPGSPSGESVTGFKLRNNYFYLEAPLGVRYVSARGKVNVFVQSTLAPALYLTNHVNANFDHSNLPDSSKSSFGNESLRKMNVHGSVGAGVEIPLAEGTSLLLMPQGTMQVLNAAGNDTSESRFYSVGLRGGVRF